MAKKNNIPEFDASDTNVGVAPTNGFSPNTTISSREVNASLRWSSFAVSALLTAIGNKTTLAGNYEYTQDGATGFNKLVSSLENDIVDIITNYTFGVGGTFTNEVKFTKNITFKGETITTDAPALVFVGATNGGFRREVTFVPNSPYPNYTYDLVLSCAEYGSQPEPIHNFGKLIFSKVANFQDATVTFPDGMYTLQEEIYQHSLEINLKFSDTRDCKMLVNFISLDYAKVETIDELANRLPTGYYQAFGYTRLLLGSSWKYYPVQMYHNTKVATTTCFNYFDYDTGTYGFVYQTGFAGNTYTITDTVSKVKEI